MSVIRIGIIGAGEAVRSKHIPKLRELRDVLIHGVVNSRPETTAKVATDYQIPRTYERWEQLIADPDIDAVLIGTWPHLHAEITCAALSAGKHVLCQARMARDLREARQMLSAAQSHPHLVCMLVPSPFGLRVGPRIAEFIRTGFLGTLREVIVVGADDKFHDDSLPLHWRQQREICGYNLLSLGMLHETTLQWIDQPTRVMAQATIFERTRRNPTGPGRVAVTVPDSVQILTAYENGARGIYHLSGITLFGPGHQIHLYGSSGTIKVVFRRDGTEDVWMGRWGQPELKKVEIPEEYLGGWRVEEEFIAAIRGEGEVKLNTFEVGVRYMEFVEAVGQSSEKGQPVLLPLP